MAIKTTDSRAPSLRQNAPLFIAFMFLFLAALCVCCHKYITGCKRDENMQAYLNNDSY